MRKKLNKWNRRRKFRKAVKILTNEAEYHNDAYHNMDFRVVNESFVYMKCQGCPDLQP